MTLLRIDGKTEQIWRFESRTYNPPVTFHRIRYADIGIPDQFKTKVHGEISYYLEVFLTGRILLCWTKSPIQTSTVSGINMAENTLQLKTSEAFPAKLHLETQPIGSKNLFSKND